MILLALKPPEVGVKSMRRIIIAIMAFSLVLAGFPLAEPLLAQGAQPAPSTSRLNSASSASASQGDPAAQAASSNPAPAAYQGESNPTVPRRGTRRRRSYERETRARRHTGISKSEKVFLASIVGTSMGIGALAGGPKGLVIGAIVGGWGAFAGHKLWHWIR